MSSKNVPQRGATVLIVEDDRDMRRMMAAWLERRGFNVHAVGTAQEARGWAEREDFEADVIILDIVLPDGWGSEVALSQMAFHPDAQFIYMSGHTRDDAVLRAAIDLDDVLFLEKPFDMSALFGLIDEALGHDG